VLTEDDPSDPHGLTPTATVRRARAYLEQDGGSRRRPVSDLYGMLMRIEILPLLPSEHTQRILAFVLRLQAGVVMTFCAALPAPETVSEPLLPRWSENGF
jgi:hypothetical protein